MFKFVSNLVSILTIILFASSSYAKKYELLNVSYDPTREFYEEYNKYFSNKIKKETKDIVKINQSHGGSAKQARAVMEGLRADVITLALGYDIDKIANITKRFSLDWQQKYPNFSSPYTSTIVFMVRKGNPKKINDWADLIKDGISVITPNPKTSGGARWNYLAALAYAKSNFETEAKQEQFLKKMLKNVPLFDTGARAATTTFAQRNIGDVLITWENEAYLAKKQLGENKFEIIYPSISILAEPPVAVNTKMAKRKGNLKIAKEYLKNLYTKQAQKMIAKHYFRPLLPDVLADNRNIFPEIKTYTVRDLGGWEEVHNKHFKDGGLFDRLTENY